jgi:hypothetical protein
MPSNGTIPEDDDMAIFWFEELYTIVGSSNEIRNAKESNRCI